MANQMQYELNFEAGLTDRYPTFAEIVSASVAASTKPVKVIAGDLDIQPSYFNRMLNKADDGARFDAFRLDDLIAATGNLLIVHWLIERFCQDEDAVQRQNIQKLSAMLPDLVKLMERVAPEGAE